MVESKGDGWMDIITNPLIVGILLYSCYQGFTLIKFMIKVRKEIKRTTPWWKLKEFGGWI